MPHSQCGVTNDSPPHLCRTCLCVNVIALGGCGLSTAGSWGGGHHSLGLTGGSASGKTTVAQKIIEALEVPWVALLSMDSFYKVLSEEQHQLAAQNEYNFDHPDAFDYDLMVQTVTKLKEGKQVDIPVYDFTSHSRAKYTCPVYGANVILFEGIMAFHSKPLRDLMDLKIFVDTDSDVRLARRLQRDIAERGRDLDGVLKQYEKFVKPAFLQYIEPTMQFADIVVPRGAANEVAIHLIAQQVKDQLKKRGLNFRSKLLEQGGTDNGMLPSSLHILPGRAQVRGMHAVIRCRETKRDEFVFFTKRLACLIIEYALSLLPFEDVIVKTPQHKLYEGKRFKGNLCGVSILRAGEVLELALLSVCKDVMVGKMLIQTNPKTGEPELHFLRLPPNIKDYHVILMDATLATGAAALMAIRVLLDHDVPQENILFVSILVATPGVRAVAYAFPQVKIITSAVDQLVNEQFHIIPGLGNYGDRYFGTGPD